jgi:hypothetical protein
VASSWRNARQPEVVAALREAGHAVYDFRNPQVGYTNSNPDAHGFHWSAIDPDWQQWTPTQYVEALSHPLSEQGWLSDWEAMLWADTSVLVLPSGRSAHLEAGYFAGARKDLFFLLTDQQEPELMYRMATAICLDVDELIRALVPRRRASVGYHGQFQGDTGIRMGRIS